MALWRLTVDLTYPVGSGRGTNSFCIRTADGVAETNIDEWAGYIRSFYEDLAIIFPTSYTASWDGTVQQLGEPNPEYRAAEDPWTVPGTDSGTSWAAAPVMACVTWRTSLASRSGRGRTFLGPLSRNAIEANGTISPTQLSVIRAAATELAGASTGIATAGALAVWSEVDGVGRDIVAASVTDQAAVLRSRR